MIFLNIFLLILHNISLYIYTVKYKSGIKIPGFLQNISKKLKQFQKKSFKSISILKKLFSCIRPNPKKILSIFFIKKIKIKLNLFHVKKNGCRNQFMIIH